MMIPAVTLVYDPDCPVCRHDTQHLSIKQAGGTFQLLNVPDNPPILQEINALNLDMDEGFVLKVGERFYHGADAIHTLALLSTRASVFNQMNFLVSKSKTLSRILYPILKTGRDLLLAMLGNTKLNNLGNRE